MKRGKKHNMYRRMAALSGILASLSMVLYPSAGNVFAQDKEEVVIPVSQVFSAAGYGEDAAAGSFSYKLAADRAGTPLPESADESGNGSSYVFSLQKETTVDISVPYTQAGEYHYTLSCITEDGSGYHVDHQEYTVDVYILTEGDDGVRLGGIYIKDKDGNKKAAASFSHSYDGGDAPEGSVIAVDPPVRKSVKGSPSEKSEFSFLLQAKDAGYPMPQGSDNGRKLINITGEGSNEFGEWTYTEPGTYVYDITEINTGEEGYEFDKTVYTITDTVTKKDNGLGYVRSITADGESYMLEEVNFVNVYKVEPSSQETHTATSEGGRNDSGGDSSNGSSSRMNRLGGKDTGDTAGHVPFIVAAVASASIVVTITIGLLRKKRPD